MTKKVVALLAIGLLGAMLFAGGSGESSSQVSLIYQNGFDPVTSGDGVAHEEKYAEYEELTGIHVEHNILTYDQSKQTLVVSGQAQEGPDCIHMLGEWVPDMVAMGLIEDITDEVKAWEDYDKFPQSTWDVATVDGRIYGIPSVASTRVLVYREDLLQAAGLEVPETWEELREAAKALTQDVDGDGTIDIYGFAFCSSSKAVRGPQEFAVLLNSVDKAELVVEKDGKWVPGFTVDQVEKVFQLYYDMMFVDKSVPPYSIGWEWEELDPNFASGTIAMVQDGSWIQQRMPDGVKPETWKTADFPYYSTPATYMEVKVEGVGTFSEHKEEALEVIDFLLEDENIQAYINDQNAVPCKEGDFELAPMLDGMKPYIESGNMTDYQDHYYPSEMAVDAQIQTFLINKDVDAFLAKFDKYWQRYNRDIIREVQEYKQYRSWHCLSALIQYR